MADTPAALVWDESGDRLYETGVDHGVIYMRNDDGTYPKGAAWNGLTKVTESPSGAEATTLWADNHKYINLVSAEDFGCTIECYTYPDEFAACNGEVTIADGVTIGQQTRASFGFSYRTKIGNDIKGDDYGYKIHLVYGCYAKPSSKDNNTTDDSPEAVTLSYEVSTTPINVEGMKPTAHLVVDSTKCPSEKLKLVEAALYGSSNKAAYLPLPKEIITMVGLSEASTYAAPQSNARPVQ